MVGLGVFRFATMRILATLLRLLDLVWLSRDRLLQKYPTQPVMIQINVTNALVAVTMPLMHRKLHVKSDGIKLAQCEGIICWRSRRKAKVANTLVEKSILLWGRPV